MVVANAIAPQVAKAIAAFATVVGMVEAPDQPYRRARLEALLESAEFGGNKSALAEALGWGSGAYVRQLLAGERPITEKTIKKIHAIKGGKYRDWFAARAPTEVAADGSRLRLHHRELPGEETTMGQGTNPEWPFQKRISPQDWGSLEPEEQAVVEWAAFEAMERVRSARPPTPSRKRRQS